MLYDGGVRRIDPSAQSGALWVLPGYIHSLNAASIRDKLPKVYTTFIYYCFRNPPTKN